MSAVEYEEHVMTAVDINARIPNNVDLAGDRRLQRALEAWDIEPGGRSRVSGVRVESGFTRQTTAEVEAC